MRSKYVVLVELSPSGGLFQYAFEMGSALATEGVQVQLWTGPRPEMTSSQPGFSVRSTLPTWHPGDIGMHSRWFLLARRSIRAAQLVLAWTVLSARLLWVRPRAVLWSQWRFPFEPLFVVFLEKMLPRTVFGIVAHEPLPRSDARDTSTPKSGRLLTHAFRTAWQRLDVAFVLGSRTRDLAVAHWRPRCPVIVIPHGSESELRAGKDVRSVTETEPVVLFFGVWSKYKGIDVLLDAFALVRAECPDARLILAGAPGADIDVAALLVRAGEVGNVDPRPGYVPADAVAPLVESARVVVTPYIRATQSGVAHLAFTFGRPVIASAIGDLPEAIEDGVSGLLVAAGDTEELAGAMLRILRDPALAARLGKAGEASVRDAWKTAAGRVVEALSQAEAAHAAST